MTGSDWSAATVPGGGAHLFVSYVSPDRDRALTVADALVAANLPVWIDRRGIPGGADWAVRIALAVR